MIATRLWIGHKFYVEPEEGVQVPVQVMGPAYWSLVNGVLDIPCRRLDLDTDETVIVSVGANEEITMIEEEKA